MQLFPFLKQLSFSDDIIKPWYFFNSAPKPPAVYFTYTSTADRQNRVLFLTEVPVLWEYIVLQSKMFCVRHLKNLNLHTTHTLQYAKLILVHKSLYMVKQYIYDVLF